jgi:hypothetical protein
MPDFQPTSEVIYLFFSFFNHVLFYWSWSFAIFREYNACSLC